MMPQAFNGYGAYPQMQMAPMPYGYYFFPTTGACRRLPCACAQAAHHGRIQHSYAQNGGLEVDWVVTARFSQHMPCPASFRAACC